MLRREIRTLHGALHGRLLGLHAAGTPTGFEAMVIDLVVAAGVHVTFASDTEEGDNEGWEEQEESKSDEGEEGGPEDEESEGEVSSSDRWVGPSLTAPCG